MSQDEIIAMAKEAGFRIGQMDTLEGSRTLVKHSGFDCLAELTRFAELLPTHNAAPAPTGFSKFELVHMASQAGMIPVSYNKTSFDTEQSAYTPDLERFAALVAAKEREACAQVCEREKARALYNFDNDLEANRPFWNGGSQIATSCEASIRARASHDRSRAP